MKVLVIVESPAKCSKIQKFLNSANDGNKYIVMASYGHIRDLGKGLKSIDVNNNFKPSYRNLPGKSKVIKQLQTTAKSCSEVVIASDLDREGESIGFHIAHILKLNPDKTKRIIFNQITKKAVIHAIQNPTKLNQSLFDAQQSRRILDRLVGFELSPLLWRHIATKLSAGRCQSPALRLIYDRERQIHDFQSSNYFELSGSFLDEEQTQYNGVFLNKYDTKETVVNCIEDCKTSIFSLYNIKKNASKNNPPPPFTTSTLQQEASSKIYLSPKMCMQVAQKLYEAGHITYMRTDSTELSKEAIYGAKQYITQKYGSSYYQFRQYKTKSNNAQEAHEAIRPVYIDKYTIQGTVQQQKLYRLIHTRTICSQMKPSEKDIFTLKINMSNRDDIVQCKTEQLTFLGYLAEHGIKIEPTCEHLYDLHENKQTLPINVKYQKIECIEKYTKSIGRYTEANLIKELEKTGIGRPSTYSNLVSTIQDRKYVIRETRPGKSVDICHITLEKNIISECSKEIKLCNEKNKLFITDIGRVVTEFLMKHFTNIMNYEFTKKIEEQLDKIANKQLIWTDVIRQTYNTFHPKVIELSDTKTTTRAKHDHKRTLGENKNGEPIFAYIGKYGPVLQIGDYSEHKKNKFCAVPKELSIKNITLEQALKICQYPKDFGEYNGENIVLKKGPYGFYISYNSQNISVNMEKIENFTRENAINLIDSKKNNNKIIKEFTKDLSIRNGPYGPYIRYKTKNVSLKNRENLEKLTKKDVMELIKNAPVKKRRTYKKKK